MANLIPTVQEQNTVSKNISDHLSWEHYLGKIEELDDDCLNQLDWTEGSCLKKELIQSYLNRRLDLLLDIQTKINNSVLRITPETEKILREKGYVIFQNEQTIEEGKKLSQFLEEKLRDVYAEAKKDNGMVIYLWDCYFAKFALPKLEGTGQPSLLVEIQKKMNERLLRINPVSRFQLTSYGYVVLEDIEKIEKVKQSNLFDKDREFQDAIKQVPENGPLLLSLNIYASLLKEKQKSEKDQSLWQYFLDVLDPESIDEDKTEALIHLQEAINCDTLKIDQDMEQLLFSFGYRISHDADEIKKFQNWNVGSIYNKSFLLEANAEKGLLVDLAKDLEKKSSIAEITRIFNERAKIASTIGSKTITVLLEKMQKFKDKNERLTRCFSIYSKMLVGQNFCVLHAQALLDRVTSIKHLKTINDVIQMLEQVSNNVLSNNIKVWQKFPGVDGKEIDQCVTQMSGLLERLQNFNSGLIGQKSLTAIEKEFGVGLINTRSSCYMNATLQMLLTVPDVRALMNKNRLLDMESKLKNYIKEKQTPPEFINELKKLLKNELLVNESEFETLVETELTQFAMDILLKKNSFLKKLHNFEGLMTNQQSPSSQFLRELEGEVYKRRKLAQDGNSHQDAQEFMNFMLDELDWKPINLVDTLSYDHGLDARKSAYSSDISIEFKSAENSVTLQQMVNDFFLPERIIESSATKTFSIEQLPEYLIIHLKRFGYTKVKKNFKICNNVELPLNVPLVVQNENYELVGCINHLDRFGSMEFGHYTAHVKRNDKWVNYDDTKVSLLSSSEMIGKGAYIVLLKKQDKQEERK